jgi:hypothetical protein
VTVEQFVRAAGKIRKLTDEEFAVLVQLVEEAQVDAEDAVVGRVCDALADAIEEVREAERVAVRFKSA